LLNTLKDSARGCLSRRIARRASKHSPSEGEGRKIKSLRGLSVEKLRRDSTVCVREDSAEVQKSKNPLRIRK
jgi:hypothetical protein